MSEINRKDVPVQAPEFLVNNQADTTTVVHQGVTVPKVAVATYDVSGGDDGATGAHGLGVYIPDNAIITRAWADVVTTFTDGSTDAATIALSAQSADDLVAAIAISDATNVWDAGIRGTKVGNIALDGNALTQIAMGAAQAGAMIKTTDIREITATVATAALTAGKMHVYVEYHVSD